MTAARSAGSGPRGTERFDDAYYRRFYGPQGAHDPERIGHLATGVHELAAWFGIRIRTVLDVGAGMGMWRDWYHSHHPQVRVRSTDVSEHACATYGHERRDIATWRPRGRFDLVVCHSVLQYLDDTDAIAAIEHLAGATRSLLYLEVPTVADFRDVIDPRATDFDVHRRTGRWYRSRLTPHLRPVGAGLWAHPDAVALFELETVAPSR